MSGATVAFARKEALEILRTWRVIVLPAILLLFAITSPLLARFTPEIITSLVGDQLSGLKLPTPTAYTAYSQWIKNVSQIGLFAIVIIYGGVISSERRTGTAVLVLTKPLSRVAFVVAKFAVHLVYLAVAVTVATLVTWLITAIAFGAAPAAAIWSSTATWFVLASMYLAMMVLFSVLIPAAAGAAGAGLAFYLALAVGAVWPKIDDFSPAGLIGRASALAAHTSTDSVLWPVLTAVAVGVVAVAIAAFVFRRQEL